MRRIVRDYVAAAIDRQIADAPAGPRDFAIAKTVLQHRAHSFDEVWYIWPLAEVPLGAIERIWP